MGRDESTQEDERGEVLTPTISAIKAAENPLNQRAIVTMGRQLEIDKQLSGLDFNVSFCLLVIFKYEHVILYFIKVFQTFSKH